MARRARSTIPAPRLRRVPRGWVPGTPIPPESEADFQDMVVRLARDLGWRVHYVTDSRRSPFGWCDLYLARCRDRRRLVVELKMPGREVTAEQAAWLETHNRTGTLAVAAWPADWTWLVELLR